MQPIENPGHKAKVTRIYQVQRRIRKCSNQLQRKQQNPKPTQIPVLSNP